MKRKRARPQTAQERFFEVFAGDEHLWSRLFGHIQGDGHATKGGDVVVLGTACEAHGEEMALALSPFLWPWNQCRVSAEGPAAGHRGWVCSRGILRSSESGVFPPLFSI